MTQASDLGAVANQPGSIYRAHINNNIQSLVTQHYGATQPPVVYPNMIWYSSGDGYIKVRNPTNTGWQNIGTIGPPLKWTNIDLPQENFVTGDIKGSYNPSQPAGWQHLNNGTIGNTVSGATARPNDDAWPLFNLIWGISSDEWCTVYAAGTLNRTGRGSSAAADWNSARHIRLPNVLGRTFVSEGNALGQLSNWTIATWGGEEFITLREDQVPSHNHGVTVSLPAHNHGLAQPLPGYEGGKSTTQGSFVVPVGSSGINWTEVSGGGSTWAATDHRGGNQPHWNMSPFTVCYYFVKL